MTITIKNRFTNAVIFTSETATTVKEALLEAIKSRADLSRAIGIPNKPETEATKRAPIPAIPKIHKTLLDAVISEGCRLNMRQWHDP